MEKLQKETLQYLYIELVKLQKEVIASGLKLLVVLEGRDAAGKDGTIKRVIKHLSPRETRVVALAKPSDRETTEWYFQRYAAHLPASGEFVIFNRSWYNRVGVEHVMGFCTQKQYEVFFNEVELFERMLIDSGFIMVKYYLDISKQEQKKRLDDRKNDPLKQWKISPIDAKAQSLWKKYSEARNAMLLNTNFKFAPWHVANAENKDDVHIALISHLLNQVNYKNKNNSVLSEKSGLVMPVSKKLVRKNIYI